ncbi:hypothetical protein F442_05195 [Phytophthora nicotianae P10297]|uniref:Uncharacterized protein n=2 Tax=Phytophthora nicotianae TaxID=4792 RepID=W2P840_PHYN3|nr:hypothetical protein PPTG_25047 [Phytophthora nicotianae INRA-310]ETM97167.1 hypothetical protein PPTG_25047 [Phytophthora nicotianae INRA-310]ETP49209.1 hypothetical protein F442_05195 [Phytophthora nicotianae P10297]
MNAHELPAVKGFIAEFGKKTLRAGDYISYHSPGYGGDNMVQARILAIDPDPTKTPKGNDSYTTFALSNS